jgi:acetyl-CoA carboxylase, biotin carboxylase subunit
VWAPDRPQALARMRRALDEFHAEGPGVCTNREFLRAVLEHPLFVSGSHDTSLLDRLGTPDQPTERQEANPCSPSTT